MRFAILARLEDGTFIHPVLGFFGRVDFLLYG
jgi:hypothetical protein